MWITDNARQVHVDQPTASERSRRQFLVLTSAAILQACAAVPDANTYLDPDPLQRHYALQQTLAGSPLSFGNTTRLLRDGAQAFPAMFQAMSQARNHINLEYFIFEDIVVDGVHLSDLLIAEMNLGVAVNIIYDAYGSHGTPAALFEKLEHAGARIVSFNPINPAEVLSGHSPNDRDHRKLMVIDGWIGFVGGINLSHTYENPPSAGIPSDGNTQRAYWRDTAVEIRGPAVAELQRLFFDTWTRQGGGRPADANYFPAIPRLGVQTVRIIGSVPGEHRPLYYLALEQAIRAARTRIWLSSGYFVPPHQEREDLAHAARQGVDLRLVVPSHSDVDTAVFAGRAAYGDLLEAGAKIFEMQNAVLHSKLAVVDGVWTAIGSSNLDRRSVVFNNEVDAIILGTDTATQVERLLQSDFAAAAPITLLEWQRRAVGERLDEWGARFWEYWL